MRDLIFIDCGADAPKKAEEWAGAALARAGLPACEAGAAAGRLAEGVRVAAGLYASGPQAMLVLTDEDGALNFELVADGNPARGAGATCAGAMWVAERRVAGGNAFRLRMPARA
ncbi:MAG: hypothetical protein VYD87_00875 [Pseudomonadota bacterium]|nr:hypothetical protein [Pseudomonadota bacterium]